MSRWTTETADGTLVLVSDDLDDATIWQAGIEMRATTIVFIPEGQPWLTERCTLPLVPIMREA